MTRYNASTSTSSAAAAVPIDSRHHHLRPHLLQRQNTLSGRSGTGPPDQRVDHKYRGDDDGFDQGLHNVSDAGCLVGCRRRGRRIAIAGCFCDA